jgi:hypothetical protein
MQQSSGPGPLRWSAGLREPGPDQCLEGATPLAAIVPLEQSLTRDPAALSPAELGLLLISSTVLPRRSLVSSDVALTEHDPLGTFALFALYSHAPAYEMSSPQHMLDTLPGDPQGRGVWGSPGPRAA